MSGQGHVTTEYVRSNQVLLRSVRTSQVKSRFGQVRVRSGHVDDMVTSRSCQVRLGQYQVKVKDRSCEDSSG